MKNWILVAAALLPLAAGAAVDYDLNGDGAVNQQDYAVLSARIVDRTAAYDARYDLDGNGSIDAVDANLLLKAIRAQGPQTQTFTVGGVSFTMVAVEGGTFTMGATAEQGSDASSNESPTHQVTLGSFSIGQTEVTQALWQAVMGSNPSYFSSSNGYTTNLQRPVEYVSYYDCQDFITKLNQLTGQTFRLPTEAEWEYAARGGNLSQGYKYSGSNTVGDVAWYYDNSYAVGSSSPDYGTHTVGTKTPNELGLYDMSGNVLEWCQDWYGSYSSAAQTDPAGPTSGSSRVLRGGSWGGLDAGGCRVSYRISNHPSSRYRVIGLRLAL